MLSKKDLLSRVPVLWAALRTARTTILRRSGKGPVCAKERCIPFRRDYEIVRIVRHAGAPLLLQEDGVLSRWRTRAGDYWMPATFDPENIRIGADEIAIDVYGIEGLPADAVVLDCGSNVGMFAYHCLRSAPQSRVICFEPTPVTAQALQRNLSPYQSRAIVIERGVWDHSGTLFLRTYDENPAANTVGDTGNLSVEVVSIDQVVAELGLQRLDYLKMDVEGAETRALQGARESIRRFRPVLAIGTEHTADVTRNVTEVIAAVESIDSSYKMQCRECRLYASPSFGSVATPHVVRFLPGNT